MSQYPAIKMFVTLSKLFSWIILVISIIIGAMFAQSTAITGAADGIVMILIWIAGFIIWTVIRVIPELLSILINIERNTRITDDEGDMIH